MTARDLPSVVCLSIAVLLAACSSGGRGGGLDGGAGGNAGAGTGGSAGVAGGGGTGGTASTDAGTTPCGDTAACAAGQVCVRTVTGGAAYICPDAGSSIVSCPADALFDKNGCCYAVEVSTYRCAARPAGCGATVTCACAAPALCTSGTCSESGASEIACLQAGV